jgi:breast cancer 2 susceptibility protein
LDRGCNGAWLRNSWIKIHARWVVWKLAAYERKFSRFLGGHHLTYENLIKDMKSRFEREIVEGIRPPLRKILNSDASPGKMMILVVCQVLPCHENINSDTQPLQHQFLELSDGWYFIKAELDPKLTKYVQNNLIKVGTKLLVSNAQLVGNEDGVDPLDKRDEVSKSVLQLTANATRLAKWNAKLGFVNSSNSRAPKGKLLIKRLSDVVEGGGNLPAIQLFVQRVYSLLYYEKSESDSSDPSSTRRPVLSEQEEDDRRRVLERNMNQVIELVAEKVQTEIEKVRGPVEIWC